MFPVEVDHSLQVGLTIIIVPAVHVVRRKLQANYYYWLLKTVYMYSVTSVGVLI